MDQVNKIVQENSANSEQSAAAAGELDSQVKVMRDLIESFQLSQSSHSEAPRAAKHKPPAREQPPTAAKAAPKTGPKPAAKPAARPPAKPGPKAVRPERAIPLEEGDVEDF